MPDGRYTRSLDALASSVGDRMVLSVEDAERDGNAFLTDLAQHAMASPVEPD